MVKVYSCNICKKLFQFPEILAHIKEEHHVDDGYERSMQYTETKEKELKQISAKLGQSIN